MELGTYWEYFSRYGWSFRGYIPATFVWFFNMGLRIISALEISERPQWMKKMGIVIIILSILYISTRLQRN